jgi:PAS domain S-box-containing protein
MTDQNSNLNRPNPIDIEVISDNNQIIVSKTDLSGTIDYANETFANVSGYEEYELVGKPFSLIRHPDMPKIIFKILWDNLKIEKKFRMFFKNLSKSGNYYWVSSDFEYNKDSDGNIIEYISRANTVVANNIENDIVPLYKKLLLIEQASGIKYSEKYLIGFLEEKGLNFEDFNMSLLNTDKNTTVSEKKEVVVPIFEPEKLPEIIEETKIVEQVVEVEKVEKIEETKFIEKTEPILESSIIDKEQKTEIKKENIETTDFSTSEYEEVQRETRSGFIGKLFNRGE